MPLQSQDSPLCAFLKALREQKIDCILIGAMAAIEQGAPLMTVDCRNLFVRVPNYAGLANALQDAHND